MWPSADAQARFPGRFVTLEGGEGAGKSTQARRLVERLARAGLPALATREPGGSPLAERYRTALLAGGFARFGPAAEALAFSAARIDHLDRTIVPALRSGVAVVCDRFTDSTRAYQGALGHLDPRLIGGLERVVVGPHGPNLTLILDLPPEVGLGRAAARRADAAADRFERQELGFHAGLRRAFLAIAESDRDRYRVIDASLDPDTVADAIWRVVAARFGLAAPPADPS